MSAQAEEERGTGVPPRDHTFAPHDPVRIVEGLLRGSRGRVIRRASWNWAGSIPLYLVDVEGVALVRALRADYLARAQ